MTYRNAISEMPKTQIGITHELRKIMTSNKIKQTVAADSYRLKWIAFQFRTS